MADKVMRQIKVKDLSPDEYEARAVCKTGDVVWVLTAVAPTAAVAAAEAHALFLNNEPENWGDIGRSFTEEEYWQYEAEDLCDTLATMEQMDLVELIMGL